MKKIKNLTILIFLFLSLNSFSQSKFVINNFDVEIELNKNGSFTVTENIKLNFTEEQRGIIPLLVQAKSFNASGFETK